jgi:hypothetical protein
MIRAMGKKIQLSFFAVVVLVAASLVNASAVPGAASPTGDRHLTGPMYEILGILSEYISRFDCYSGEPHPDLLETFYPSELDLADRFEKLLAAHAQITGLKRDWRRKIGKQGHVNFLSSLWSNALNSFYVRVGKRWPGSSPVERNWATLDPAIFVNASREDMLRFLQGAYSRYGSKDKSSAIEMANASFKVETIAGVLKKMACVHVTIFVLPLLPHGYRVHFDPSPAVRELLGIQRTVMAPKNDTRCGNWKLFKKVN